MKKISLFICLFVIFAACSKKEEQPTGKWPISASEQFTSTLTKTDTLFLKETCTQCMEFFKTNQNDLALDKLYQWNEDETALIPLSDECKRKLNKNFTLFPVENYEMNGFSFNLPEDNTFSFDIIFTAIGSDGSPKEGRTKFAFCPVKKDGNWFLTVKGMEHGSNNE